LILDFDKNKMGESRMKEFRVCGIDDIFELQRLSQLAYSDAFYFLLNNDDVNDFVNYKYSLDNLIKEIEDSSNNFLFLDLNGKPIGYMKYIIKENCLEIDRLYILSKFKRLGAGLKFIDRAEKIANENNIESITLGVLEKNKPAISFYIKMGFKQYSYNNVVVGKTEYRLLLMKKEIHKIKEDNL